MVKSVDVGLICLSSSLNLKANQTGLFRPVVQIQKTITRVPASAATFSWFSVRGWKRTPLKKLSTSFLFNAS